MKRMRSVYRSGHTAQTPTFPAGPLSLSRFAGACFSQVHFCVKVECPAFCVHAFSMGVPGLVGLVCSLVRCSFVHSFIGSFVAGLTRRNPVPSPGTHTRDRVGKREGPGNGACLERPKRELNSRQFFTVHFVENAGKQSILMGRLRRRRSLEKVS